MTDLDGTGAVAATAGTAHHPPVAELRATVEKGGAAKYHEKNAEVGKLFARERVALLLDEGRSSRTGCSPT